jgi:hypothetical protein
VLVYQLECNMINVCQYFLECGYITQFDFDQCKKELGTVGPPAKDKIGVVGQKIITEVQLSISSPIN